ncbi:hypothetical protein SBY92_003724 [Candida maltosa Xu316]|uniref:Aminopeptidase n=1 Tax=Candida maltosa (strain Xu316) TaxID=1245528 RepID=M3JD77_CANMX|nr:hypothetical protein G210_4873 [Candida maltosa Xu316]
MVDSSVVPLTLSNKFIPVEYHYQLDINHSKPNFNGTAIISLGNNPKHTSSSTSDDDGFKFTLHSHKLVIIGASIGNEKLKIEYNKASQTVTFTSEQSIDVTSQPLTIKYMGQIKTINTYNDDTQGLFKTNYLDSETGKSDNYILTTHFQPHFAKQVFPIIDELTHKAMIKLDLKTLKRFQVCCNGEVERESDEDDDWKVTKFVYSKPIHSAIMGFMISDFNWQSSKQVTVGGMKDSVRIYAPNGDLSQTNVALSIIDEYLPKLETVFGEYPLKHLYLVAVPFLKDGVMENWSMINIISPNLLVDESNATKQIRSQLTELIVHELVHQWIGNWVSFDDWNCLWFNEAFATWAARKIIYGDYDYYTNFLSTDCYYDGENFKAGSIFDYTQKVNTGLNSTTESIFNNEVYEKGMILLNMIDKIFQNEGLELLVDGFQKKIIPKYQNQAIKVFDIWQELNDLVPIDLPSFTYSWNRSKGYPLLKVSRKGDKVVIEQHCYLQNVTIEEANIEDVPFHVPLFIKALTSDGSQTTKIVNVLMTDRSMDLEIPQDQLICINSGRSGYYRVLYDDVFSVETLKLMSPEDITMVVSDLGSILGSAVSTSKDLINFIKLYDNLLQIPFNWSVWECAISYLEPILDILRHFTEFSQFDKKWLNQFTYKLFKLVKWNDDYIYNIPQQYNVLEWKVRASILQLNIGQKEVYTIAHKYFQTFMNPSTTTKKFIPRELLPSVFNITMNKSTMKDYKKVLELVKNRTNSSLLKQTNITKQEELQTISLTSLSFVTNAELIHKTLNFVNSNIDSKLIELGLIGFTFTNDYNDIVFDWFKLNYDNWIMRSLRKGSDWSKQIGVTAKNILKILLKIMSNTPENKFKINQFIETKLKSLPKHGLAEEVEIWNLESQECFKIGGFYEDLVNEVIKN